MAHLLWQDEGKWTVHDPSLPGVYGVGDTQAQAEQDLFEGIDEMMGYLASIGETPERNR